MAIAAAAEALIERVEPNCAIEKVAVADRPRARRTAPGPPARTGSTPAAASPSSRGGPTRAGCRCRAAAPPRSRRYDARSAAVGVVPDVLVAVGDHRAATVPAPVADDVHLRGQERVGGADDRADVEVVLPVLDRDVEVVPAEVEVGDDRLEPPVAVAVDHVAPVALGEQLLVVLARRSGHSPRPRPDADLGRTVGHRVVRRALVVAPVIRTRRPSPARAAAGSACGPARSPRVGVRPAR